MEVIGGEASQTRRNLLNISGAVIMSYDDKLIEEAVRALMAAFSSGKNPLS